MCARCFVRLPFVYGFSVFTLNTMRKEPSLKLVLVMRKSPISFVDSTCWPMHGQTS